MTRIHAHDLDNESQIEFLEEAGSDYPNADLFYAAAIRTLWEGTDLVERTERYIDNSNKRGRTVSKVASMVRDSAAITPIDGLPQIKEPEKTFSWFG
jgi:hypothetical protein